MYIYSIIIYILFCFNQAYVSAYSYTVTACTGRSKRRAGIKYFQLNETLSPQFAGGRSRAESEGLDVWREEELQTADAVQPDSLL